jgi:hypothetical protein
MNDDKQSYKLGGFLGIIIGIISLIVIMPFISNILKEEPEPSINEIVLCFESDIQIADINAGDFIISQEIIYYDLFSFDMEDFLDTDLKYMTYYTNYVYLVFDINLPISIRFWSSGSDVSNVYTDFNLGGLYDFSFYNINEIIDEMELEPIYTPIYNPIYIGQGG